MKLLTVSHFYDAHGGGIERVAAQLCSQFSRAGHDVIWAASSSDCPPCGSVEALPLKCINPIEALTGLPMPIPGPGSIMALAKAIRKCDAVIVHDSLYITSVFAMFLAKLAGKPIVLVQHIAGITFASAAMRVIMRLANFLITKRMLNAADGRVFISDVVRRELLGEGAWRKSIVLYNGVDTSIFYLRKSLNEPTVRVAYGLPSGVPLAIFVGRFVQKKGLSILEVVARRNPGLHIALVGAGHLNPSNWDLPNVHVLGVLEQWKIGELFNASDFLLLPSVGEGFPLVIQEAMACGLPVICGQESAGADPEASRWLTGVSIELGDIRSSAERVSAAIAGLKMDENEREAMATYAADHYNWEKMAKNLVALVK